MILFTNNKSLFFILNVISIIFYFNIIVSFQHKDDPLFVEFIEAHVNDKTAWIKDALVDLNKSDNDSGVEDEIKENNDAVQQSEEKDKITETKVANAQISDLDVCI